MIHWASRAKSDEFADDIGEARLFAQHFPGEAVDVGRAGVDLAFRIDVKVQVPAGRPPIDELDGADLDDPMPLLRVEARGLGIEYQLAHWRGDLIIGDTA